MQLFDSHFHIIDPSFPLVPNQGYLPSPFSCEDYLQAMAKFQLDVIGGAIVSGSFQAFDQSYLLAALKTLGSTFVGVTQLPLDVDDQTILQLNEAGVRAIRFNIKRGMQLTLNEIQSFGARCYELAKWHSEFYLDASNLPDMAPMLLKLPQVSIDHLGLSKAGFPHLLKLIDKGIYIKATGFSRVDFPVLLGLRQIIAVNSDCLMFGTDLPGTRAPKPFDEADMQIITDNFPKDIINKIFYQNALRFYRVRQIS
ncbi:(2-pyrone-4,6-)dicarboxylic acid hydrolase [Legionella beliardensis]|uniref:(2-pyrone-4,6-)dicarboxylic acid hydrolase n=1 Tax=Legionella beliardensis TaxID=91822 RepID=A0A378HZP5_9GAMM|nr:amidohydrolase family protein [Legionella beliardensis]STX28408.1 (2-pyrone-4,6-)dicarboxylic acid hydrolase [Legionella beliardensis]